ncbi:hypothetical protein [Kitasatospora sp. NPDC005856]|uniref:hypothetical protein n=1 Tax=Kitasatospora sp. NPDC005856 TaxID=3154566 RepID=UPI0033D2E8FC
MRDGRVVHRSGPASAPGPVVHAEAWQAGSTLRTALAQHPVHTPFTRDEDGDQEHALLGGIRSRVRRRVAGTTLENIQQALEQAQFEERCADRHADAGDESAELHAAAALQEWQRVRGEAATTPPKAYDPDHDLGLRRALHAERHRQDIADRATEAGHHAHRNADLAHREQAGPAAQPLYTALERAGLHFLTDDDHRAVHDLTRTLDPTTAHQVTIWLERTRITALALRGTTGQHPTRPVVRRSRP